LFFHQKAAKNLSTKSPPPHHGPTDLLFHRRATDCLFASARSRVSESNSIQQEGLNEVPFDDYYHPGHDRHSDRDLAERWLLWWRQVLLRRSLLRKIGAGKVTGSLRRRKTVEVFRTFDNA
jgi:hypothetical protein